MKWAVILNAEIGWKALIVREDKSPSYIDISHWGIAFSEPNKLYPLNDMMKDISDMPNFVLVIDPNDPPANHQIEHDCYWKHHQLSLRQIRY